MKPPERVSLGSSSSLFLGLATIAIAAVVSFHLAPIPAVGWLLGDVLVMATAITAIRRHALRRSSNSIVAVEPVDSSGQCILTDISGVQFDGTVIQDSIVWPWLMLIRVSANATPERTSIVIVRDCVTDEGWRRLSIWLRWKAAFNEA